MRASKTKFLRSFAKRLAGDESGNALLMVGLALPVLIGGAGFGTDLAQWYMWKRELQFAVDQAAIAGAWAKASTSSTVQLTYQDRARQEYNANLASVGSFDSGPTISIANYNGHTNNSVLVTATASKALPFSGIFLASSPTISVSAQATWNSSADFHACLLTLDPSASDSFEFGGSVGGSATCGAAAISDADEAMKKLGNTSVPLGTLVSEGGIDPGFSANGTIFQNQANLANPYEGLSPPSSSGQPARTYPSTCPVATPASTTYNADGSTKTHYTYAYFKGANSNSWSQITYTSGTGYIANSWSSAVAFTNKSVTSNTTTGVQTESSAAAGTAVKISGNGQNAIWRVPYTSTQDTITTITTITTPANDGIVHLSPGIYASLTLNCTTEFSAGVYFVSGSIDFGQNKTVTGTGGVMFELTSSSGTIHINSNSNVTLSGISAATLINNYGYSADDAAKVAGMLIWDPDSTSAFQLNGNSTLHLSGILYMPNRDATFNGNSSAAGNCIMVASKTMKINGNFNLSNFCVSTGGSAMSIGGTTASVKLVA